jgi:hypothetical protein
MSPRRYTRAGTAGFLAVAVLTAAALTAAPAGAETIQGTSCGTLFDDFAYRSVQDRDFLDRGWEAGNYRAGTRAGVTFAEHDGQGVARLTARTDGTPSGTTGAELSNSRTFPRFWKGTYLARLRFAESTDSDVLLQGFSGRNVTGDPIIPRIDVAEHRTGATPVTTHAFSTGHRGELTSVSEPGSLAGWHDVMATISGGVMRFFVDGQQVGQLDRFYPRGGFGLFLTNEFARTGPGSGVRTYTVEVDYVVMAQAQTLTPAQADDLVAGFRAAGTSHSDTVLPGCEAA